MRSMSPASVSGVADRFDAAYIHLVRNLKEPARMSSTLTIELPDDVLTGLQREPGELADELRLAAAVKWYELGRVSQGKAAQIAGMGRAAFLDALARFRVSPFQETADDVVSFVKDNG